MLSIRSRLSLCQLLARATQIKLAVLFEKHGLEVHQFIGSYSTLQLVRDLIGYQADDAEVNAVLNEVLRTKGDWIDGWEENDERWQDFLRCVELDGYRIDGEMLVPIEPQIEGTAPVEDDLQSELEQSGLADAPKVQALLNASAQDYRQPDINYNGCLTNGRAALQTLAKAIAEAQKATQGGSFDGNRWGQVLAYLRTSGLITEQEETGISGVFTFVSPGAHTLVGLTEREMARLGRSLIAHMCYFLVKRFNGQNG